MAKLKEEQVNLQTEEEYSKGNVITIAGRPREVYTQTIVDALQKYDQVELCTLDIYVDKVIYIIHQFEALGIIPFKPEKGKIKFDRVEEEIVTRDKIKYKKWVNKIMLTKQQELFRFTKNMFDNGQ